MSTPARLTAHDMTQLFHRLSEVLAAGGVLGEVYVVGGAVMTLVLGARDSTRDIDALFRPKGEMRTAVAQVAEELGAPQDWLNDAVKGFLSDRGRFDPYLDLPGLRVFTAHPEYLLAMKCMAMRLGAEYADVDDVRFLLRSLNVLTVRHALDIVTRYFEPSQLPQRTHFALEELLGGVT